MKVAIVGCGLIGRKRSLALGTDDRLVACCDVNLDLARKFGDEFGCKYYQDYNSMLNSIECDVVIIAVVNKYIELIVEAALRAGKHVISEKPLGRNLNESLAMVTTFNEALIKNSSLKFKTGFNHRFHPAVFKAKELVSSGTIGEIFSIRARYGHGGRPGMEKEWRASKELCGGGELLDQGVHVIDLIRWFGGDVKEVFGIVETKYWNLEVEDSASVILKTAAGTTAQFNVSWTNWKNIFSFEIFGSLGYLRIEGLGGSYGTESLEVGIKNPAGGKPQIDTFEFGAEDISWKEEWHEFKNAVSEGRRVIGDHIDGLEANRVIDAIYKSALSKEYLNL